jgi:hypothetical protein
VGFASNVPKPLSWDFTRDLAKIRLNRAEGVLEMIDSLARCRAVVEEAAEDFLREWAGDREDLRGSAEDRGVKNVVVGSQLPGDTRGGRRRRRRRSRSRSRRESLIKDLKQQINGPQQRPGALYSRYVAWRTCATQHSGSKGCILFIGIHAQRGSAEDRGAKNVDLRKIGVSRT